MTVVRKILSTLAAALVFLLTVWLVPLDSIPIRDQVRLTGVFEPGGFVAIVSDDVSVEGFYYAAVELRPVTAEAQSVWSGQKVVDGDTWGSSISGDFTYPRTERIAMALMVPIPEQSKLRSAKVDIRKGYVVWPHSLGYSGFVNRRIDLDNVVTLPIGSSASAVRVLLRVLLAMCRIWLQSELLISLTLFLISLFLAVAFVVSILPSAASD